MTAELLTEPALTDTTAATPERRRVPQAARLAALVHTTGDRPRASVRSPIDDTVLGEVPECDDADVHSAVELARHAQHAWSALTVDERSGVAKRFANLVLDHRDELLDIVQDETGKSRTSAFEELMDVAMVSGYYAKHAADHLAPRKRGGAIPGLTKTVEHRVPKGVVGVISPWNYPLTLPATDSIPALLAGNAVVTKPDSQTPFTTLRIGELLRDAGLPDGLFTVVTGPGSEVGPSLISKVDFVMFTGSTATGRTVATQCAERLIGCSAELGGKNPLLVLADADVEKAAAGAVSAVFSNTGQLCISVERMYVHTDVHDRFVDHFIRNVGQMRIGANRDWDLSMGSLTSRQQLDTVQAHVDDAVAKGAAVLAGGRPRPDLGQYVYEPTVLAGVTDDMTLAREETFGPVVAIHAVADDDEAIRRANDTEYGLNASVWSKGNGERVARQLRAGTVNVNDGYVAAWASHDAPMGGVKNSGIGRRHGRDGIQKYTDAQTISQQRLMPIGPPSWMSAEQYANVMTKAVRVLNRIR